ncbi:MAG: hypothetical protein HZA53_07510 [Planctomycetes bacterium]|nr:hypothetical protein [Planctomycetota bacterium]
MKRDEELEVLEARLSARERIMPSSALRQRIVLDLERARLRERLTWLAACAAVLLATFAMRCALPGSEADRGRSPVVIDERELAGIGVPAVEAARWAAVLNAARIPIAAPWTDTRSNASASGDRKHERGGG